MSDASERYAQQIEAERHLEEMIAAQERQLGRDHPSLGVPLNELSRLLVRRGDYARAEPLLKRLLLLARARGDRHPDVATALAGIAVAKRGLGHHAAAELLYRNALQIREETLAPDHMAIVVTLEQLAETCAARGSFAEALVHLQRALLRRERSLGADHASVQGLRARIAELERCAIESAARAETHSASPPPASAPAPAPPPATVAPPVLSDVSAPVSSIARATAEWRAKQAEVRSEVSAAKQGRRSGELAFLYVPEPTAPESPAPDHSTPEPAASARSQSVAPSAYVAPRPAPLAPAAAPVADAHAPVAASSLDFPAAAPARRRTTRYAFAAAALVVLAASGFAVSSRATDESEYTPQLTGAEAHAAVVRQASMASAPTVTEPANGTDARETDSATTPAVSAAHTAPIATPTTPAAASETPSPAPAAPVALPRLRRIVVPGVAMPSVDSVVLASANVARDAGVASLETGLLRATSGADAAAVTPPVLVYSPTLRFPDELRDKRVEGEVVVQFRVNEKGRVEASSMQVVQSAHETLTEAVRSVLPRFRFQPARSPAPASKPQAAWVQFRAQFTAKN